jgi:hypothetical protein
MWSTSRAKKLTRCRQETPMDEHLDLVNLVQALQILMNRLSVQVLTAMEILVKHMQGQQQLQDECTIIWLEVEEMRYRLASSSLVNTTLEILDEASSPSPRLMILGLNSPSGPTEAEIDMKHPPT